MLKFKLVRPAKITEYQLRLTPVHGNCWIRSRKIGSYNITLLTETVTKVGKFDFNKSITCVCITYAILVPLTTFLKERC